MSHKKPGPGMGTYRHRLKLEAKAMRHGEKQPDHVPSWVQFKSVTGSC